MSNNIVYILVIEDNSCSIKLKAFKSKKAAKNKFTKLLDEYLHKNDQPKDCVEEFESRCSSYEECIKKLFFSDYKYTLAVKELNNNNSNEVYVMKIQDNTFDQVVSEIQIEYLLGPVMEFKLFNTEDDARKKFTELIDKFIAVLGEDIDIDTENYINNYYNDFIEELSFMDPGLCDIKVEKNHYKL